MDIGLCLNLPILVKARPSEDGRRVIEVEASNECVDSESDVILQQALLGSASEFLAKGHIDRDHLSEIGDRIPGLPHPPAHYVVGRPLEVNDLGGGRTGVVCELNKSAEAEAIWKGLNDVPPVNWRASIYGFPTADGLHNAQFGKCELAPDAGRYVVSKMRWQSLALTRNPVNQAITGSACIVTAKAFIDSLTEVAKAPFSDIMPDGWPMPEEIIPVPRNKVEMLGHYTHHCCEGKCPFTKLLGRSIAGFREHFRWCSGQDYDTAHIYANALMQMLKRQKSESASQV